MPGCGTSRFSRRPASRKITVTRLRAQNTTLKTACRYLLRFACKKFPNFIPGAEFAPTSTPRRGRERLSRGRNRKTGVSSTGPPIREVVRAKTAELFDRKGGNFDRPRTATPPRTTTWRVPISRRGPDFAPPCTRRRHPEGPGRPAVRETRVRTPTLPSFGSVGRATAEIRSDTFGKNADFRAKPSREPTLRPRRPRTDVLAAAAATPIESRASRLPGFARSRLGNAPFRNRATAKVVLDAFFRAASRFLFSCGRTTPPTTSSVLTFSIGRNTALSEKNTPPRGRSGFEARHRHFPCFERRGVGENHGDALPRAESESRNRVSISAPVRPQKIPKVRFRRPTLRRPLPHVAAPTASREVAIERRASRLRGRRVARS